MTDELNKVLIRRRDAKATLRYLQLLILTGKTIDKPAKASVKVEKENVK